MGLSSGPSGRLIILSIPTFCANADVIQAPTFNCPTLGDCYPSTSNEFMFIAQGHRKSTDWVNLALAPTRNSLMAHDWSQLQIKFNNFDL